MFPADLSDADATRYWREATRLARRGQDFTMHRVRQNIERLVAVCRSCSDSGGEPELLKTVRETVEALHESLAAIGGYPDDDWRDRVCRDEPAPLFLDLAAQLPLIIRHAVRIARRVRLAAVRRGIVLPALNDEPALSLSRARELLPDALYSDQELAQLASFASSLAAITVGGRLLGGPLRR